jgi:hypothetical protein
VAAVTLLLYFIAAKISLALASGRVPGAAVALVFLYFFFNATRGAFALHRIKMKEDPDYHAPRAWVTFGASVAAVLLFGGVTFGVFMDLGMVPDTAVVPGEELGDEVRLFLLEQDMIEPDEIIVLFYSAALLDFRKEGNVLTDRRALSYEELDGELWFSSLDYGQIADVAIEDPGGPLNDALVAVFDATGEGFRLWVSTEAGGLQRFLEELERRRGEGAGA